LEGLIVRLLVLGGSWFVGRVLVEEALRRGHDVTVFHRGRSSGPPPGVRVIHGDREDRSDLARLASDGPWDVVIDVPGSVPAVVRDSARALADAVDRYVFMSTVSVYRIWPHEPVSEDSPLHPGDPDFDPGWRHWDAVAYGPLKAGCEAAVRREFGDRSLFLRPGVVLGPHEYVGRMAWWLDRMRRAGQVLAPGRPDRGIQPVDVRDLVAFTLSLIEQAQYGTFNVAAPIGRDSYGDLLTACRDAIGSDAEIIWVDEQWLVDHGVRQWTELPLWRTAPGTWAMDQTRGAAQGLMCRPLRETVADTWTWLAAGGRAVDHERQAEHGIDPVKETTLLAEWAAARSTAGQTDL
jgi:2'-hydroxyisoflavone reductase